MNKIIEYGSLYGQHSRWGVYNAKGIAPTLTAAMGLGGGHTPSVLVNERILCDNIQENRVRKTNSQTI